MGRGATQHEGGAYKVLPPTKRGSGKFLAKLKGDTKSFGVVFMWKLEVLAILKEGRKSFHSLKGVARKVLPCLQGRVGAK